MPMLPIKNKFLKIFNDFLVQYRIPDEQKLFIKGTQNIQWTPEALENLSGEMSSRNKKRKKSP